MLDRLQLDVSELQVTMIVSWDGDIIQSKILDLETVSDHSELKYIAKLASLRFHVGDYHKILNGLEMTISLFRDNFLIVTQYQQDLLVLILSRKANLLKILDSVKGITTVTSSRT